jgi:hypothetical protein
LRLIQSWKICEGLNGTIGSLTINENYKPTLNNMPSNIIVNLNNNIIQPYEDKENELEGHKHLQEV